MQFNFEEFEEFSALFNRDDYNHECMTVVTSEYWTSMLYHLYLSIQNNSNDWDGMDKIDRIRFVRSVLDVYIREARALVEQYLADTPKISTVDELIQFIENQDYDLTGYVHILMSEINDNFQINLPNGSTYRDDWLTFIKFVATLKKD